MNSSQVCYSFCPVAFGLVLQTRPNPAAEVLEIVVASYLIVAPPMVACPSF